MAYEVQTWADKNPSFPLSAARMNHLEAGLLFATEEAEGGEVNVRRYGAKISASAVLNREAINNAIASLGSGGGVVKFTEPGTYLWSGVLNLKEKTNIRLVGQGGTTGGGGIGFGAANQAGTNLQCEATPPGEVRAVDMRVSIGVRFEHLYFYCNSKQLNEAEGVFIDAAGSDMPGGLDWGAENTGPGKIWPKISGLYLASSNGGSFKAGRISGFNYNVLGRIEAANFSVAHHFDDMWFIGAQKGHILNAGENWTFTGCVWEQLRNEKGESAGAGAFTLTNNTFLSPGLTLIGGWMSTTPAEEKGTAITWAGSNLRILGTSLGCAETLVEIAGVSHNVTICSPVGFAKTGIFLPAAAKGSTNIEWLVDYHAAVTTAVVGATNAELGSRFLPKTPIVKAWGPIASPAATVAALKIAVDELRELAKNKGEIE